jgi:hypothetical protein
MRHASNPQESRSNLSIAACLMSNDPAIQTLQTALSDLQQQRVSISAFCQVWRAQTSLLEKLPPRYGQVMEDLLGRLEAGSLFSEESCSFSQEDLLHNLAVWLEKAGQTLTA